MVRAYRSLLNERPSMRPDDVGERAQAARRELALRRDYRHWCVRSGYSNDVVADADRGIEDAKAMLAEWVVA